MGLMTKESLAIAYNDYELAADWYQHKNAEAVLLVFVGYGSSKARNEDFIADVAQAAQMHTLAVDLSGHGESPHELDDTTPAQHVQEALHVFDWLRHTYPDMKVNVMGTSYGGYIAAWLTRFRNFDKLVLRTPAIYRPEDYDKPHRLIEKGADIAAYRNDRAQLLQNPLFLQKALFSGDTLVVTHSEDEAVPPTTSDVYQEAFNAEVYAAAGFYHAFRDDRNPADAKPAYVQAISAWLCKP